MLQESVAFRLLYEVRARVLHANDPRELLEDICNLLVGFGGYPLAWIEVTDERIESKKITALCGKDSKRLSDLKTVAAIGAISADDIEEAEPIVIQNISKAPGFEQWGDEFTKCGVHSAAIFPLKMKNHLGWVLCSYRLVILQ